MLKLWKNQAREGTSMTQLAPSLGATKSANNLLVMFIPSVDRHGIAINQDEWVENALNVLGDTFGGATAFPQAKGVWRDDEQGGALIFDEPVIINCYTAESLIEQHVEPLRQFLNTMGKETRQGAVGLVIDQDYLEITF